MAEYVDKTKLIDKVLDGTDVYYDFEVAGLVEDLPTIEIVHCRECKHWKDSDGVYRRGFDAESKCRVNCDEVMRGNWFCADGERKENEWI